MGPRIIHTNKYRMVIRDLLTEGKQMDSDEGRGSRGGSASLAVALGGAKAPLLHINTDTFQTSIQPVDLSFS